MSCPRRFFRLITFVATIYGLFVQKDFLPRVTANIFILNYVKDVQIGLLFVFLQLCQQIGKGASAMAYGVFLFGSGFGKTFSKVVAVKQTVIPETAVSCFGK